MGYKLNNELIKDIDNIAFRDDLNDRISSTIEDEIFSINGESKAIKDLYKGMDIPRFVNFQKRWISSTNTNTTQGWGRTPYEIPYKINDSSLPFVTKDCCPIPNRVYNGTKSNAWNDKWGDARFGYGNQFNINGTKSWFKDKDGYLTIANTTGSNQYSEMQLYWAKSSSDMPYLLYAEVQGERKYLSNQPIIFLDIVGGGGGGGGAYGNTTYRYDGGGGGGGGASAHVALDLSKCSKVIVQVGLRGTFGNSSNREDNTKPGTSGSDSVLTLTTLPNKDGKSKEITLTCGGGGGGGRATDNNGGDGGTGGTASNSLGTLSSTSIDNGLLYVQMYNGKNGGKGSSENTGATPGGLFRPNGKNDALSNFDILNWNYSIGKDTDGTGSVSQCPSGKHTSSEEGEYSHGGGGGVSALSNATTITASSDAYGGYGASGSTSYITGGISAFTPYYSGHGCCILHYKWHDAPASTDSDNTGGSTGSGGSTNTGGSGGIIPPGGDIVEEIK